LSGRQYLVGETFSRADLTTAAMLMVLRPAPDELFVFPAPMRPFYTEPLAEDPGFSAVFA
jgi:glutathione S-transferase